MAFPPTTISTGETVTVATGETLETALVENQGTLQNQGTVKLNAVPEELTGTATDIDSGTAALQRLRELQGTARPTLVIDPGETVSVAAGETRAVATVKNAGTLETQGTVAAGIRSPADIDAATGDVTRVRALASLATDIDTATGTATRLRTLAGTSADIDAESASLQRLRELTSLATDIDASDGAVNRVRDLTATAADIDAAEGLLFIAVASDKVVEAIVELLQNADASEWTDPVPQIKRYWDDAQSERGPGADQDPICYVWSPADTSLERFSMDGTRQRQNQTVEIQIWSLDTFEPKIVQSDVTDIISAYIDDNKAATPFTDVEPTGQSDFREQSQRRNTDHYVMAVTVDTDGLRRTDK